MRAWRSATVWDALHEVEAIPRASAPVIAMLACTLAFTTATWAQDRHAGYYYPTPASSETYVSRTPTLADSDRRRRIGFVTELSNQMLDSPYPPPFALFAKGDDAQKMIITSLHANSLNTLYRMRGLLAQLTARARSTPMFRAYEVDDLFTFLDLLKLLGFRQLTFTDGDRFAHQILIE